MPKTETLSKIRELNSESGHSVKLQLNQQIIRLNRLSSSTKFTLIDNPAQTENFVSCGTLYFKARQFEDGLLATIEKLLQNGLGSFIGKKRFLEKLANLLLEKHKDPIEDESNKALIVVFAAAKTSGCDLKLGDNWSEPVDEFLKDFENNPNLSKPVQIFSWDDELKSIFKQERILQTPLKLLEDQYGAQLVADTIKNDQDLFDTYVTYLEITQKISNPFRIPDLRILFDQSESTQYDIEIAAIVPPIVSYEEDLLAKIVGPGNPVPENLSLLDEFINFIRQRKVSLRPTQESGWYDYSTWNLAPLVSIATMVESKHLEVESSYSKLMEEVFKGSIELDKVKEDNTDEQDKLSDDSTPPRIQVQIDPLLNVEPLPTFYYRRGFTYRFLKNVLLAVFEESEIKTVKRHTKYGDASADIISELEYMQNLFFGAHRRACKDLGMDPAQTPEESLEVFKSWSSAIDKDIDFQRDSRTVTPVSYDVETKRTKINCFFGFREELIEISFEKPPEVEIYDKAGKKMPRKNMWLRPTYVGNEGQTSDEISYSFTKKVVRAIYPIFDEFYVKAEISEDEFRKILAKSNDPVELKKLLESR